MDGSTSRDEAWQFFTLGRAIERVDMTARLLATKALTSDNGAGWSMLLRSCGAYESYLRGARGATSAESSAAFLVLDRLFPRSILVNLLRAEEALREIEPGAGGRVGFAGEAQRLLGGIRSELEYRPASELLANLSASMDRVQETVSAASDAVRMRFFPTNVVPVWTGDVS